MFSTHDRKALEHSVQNANILLKDLKALTLADNPLLGDIASEIRNQVADIERRLKRYELIGKDTEDGI